MFGYDTGLLAFIALAMLFGGFVKGMVAIGLPIVSVGLLSSVTDAHFALGVVVFPILLTNFWQMVRAGQLAAVLRRFWPMMVSLLTGIWIASHLVTELSGGVLYGIIGSVVVLFTTLNYLNPTWRLPAGSERWASPLAGAVGGLLGGVSTIWGPPLTMLFIMLRLPKEAFIQATGTVWFAASLPLLVGYRRNGILDDPTAVLSLAACLPSFLGLWIGTWVRGKIEPESFRKVLLVVFFLIGLNLIRRALF